MGSTSVKHRKYNRALESAEFIVFNHLFLIFWSGYGKTKSQRRKEIKDLQSSS